MSEELKADYCIVGAGIAGLLVASRVATTGRSVLVVDQGPDVTEEDRARLLTEAKRAFDYQADYNDNLGEDVRTPTSGASAQRLFGTGGTALHFGGWMVRPIEADHRVRTLYGYGRDWPLSYDELEPWLSVAEHEVGVPGKDDNRYASPRSRGFPMPAHAFSWFDREILGPALARVGMQGHSCPFAVTSRPYEQEYGRRNECAGCRYCRFCPTGARYSPDRVHGAWLKTRPNVTIRNGVSLRRLETAPDGTRVVAGHAEVVDGREDVVIRARHFVLAMGGIATPRMLLLSGIGNSGGRVGVGFSDHLNSIVVMELDRHVGGMLGFPTMQCDHGRTQVRRDRESSWILLGPPLGSWGGSHGVPWATQGDHLDLRRLRQMVPCLTDFLVMHELSGGGRLDLDVGREDAFGDPVARIDLPLTDWDRTAAATVAKLAADLGEEVGAVNSALVGPECYYGHASGATAMGASPDVGVCDTDLKIFGVDNLFLCSNSVFPHLGANPPTLTLAALALRLGAHLEDR